MLSEIEIPASPRLAQALGYWRSKCGPGRLPGRADLDPIEIPLLLPYVLLIDILVNPLDFRYRLVGTEIAAISNANHTGKLFSELPGKGPGSIVWNSCAEVYRTRSPVSRIAPYEGPEPHLNCNGALLLPLFDQGGEPDMIFQICDFGRRLWPRRA